MHLIKLTLLQRARVVLFINALILFLFIIFTPYFVRVGIWGMPEWLIEGTFLAIEISVLIKLFRNYDLHSKKVEDRADKLKTKLKKQEETLIDSLEYLGRINVQMSIMKKVMGKLQFPTDQNKLDHILNEMLQNLLSLSGQKNIVLRIVDLDTKKTMKEVAVGEQDKNAQDSLGVSNEELCAGKKINNLKKEEVKIIASTYDSFSLKTFAIFNMVSDGIDSEKEELIQGIVNQCDIIFLLFNSRYYIK